MTAVHRDTAPRGSVGWRKSLVMRFSRSDLFGGLFILGCANGFAGRIGQSVVEYGWLGAVLNTFNISIIVLGSCFYGLLLILRDKSDDEAVRPDLVVSAVLLILVALPFVSLSWLAVTALSLYILLFTTTSSARRRGTKILLAVTVPMLWSKLLFDLFAKFILGFDAWLVSLILGTKRIDNMVEFADHSSSLVIWPACSSMANVSLAFLCWMTLSQWVEHKWRPQDVFWCLFACASVVAVNVTRISLMGLNLSYYAAIHSQIGDAITNSIILALTVAICVLGVRREFFRSL
jgi:hypothetical protein